MNEYVLVKGAYNSHFKYFTEQFQDKFIANLFKFKRNGYFLDIGSGDPNNGNNSKFFDTFLDWKGICVDLANHDYSNRNKTTFYCTDATIFDYANALKMNNMPNVIDYLSLDVDEATNIVLNRIPFKDYTFSAITIEHDFYKEGEQRRSEQRKILTNLGFYLLCSNVCLNYTNLPWEDWWINPKIIDIESVKFLQCDGITINEVIDKFTTKNSI